MKKVSKKLVLILLIAPLFLSANVFLFWPRPSEAAVSLSPKVRAQIRKLQAQIEKLRLILADLQKANVPKLDSPKVVQPIITIPVIKTISPNLGDDQTVFTITGANFSSSGNQVKTTYNTINNISSPDGRTLVFSTGLFREAFGLLRSNPQAWQKSANLPVNLWVENSHGQSNQVIFYLKFKP